MTMCFKKWAKDLNRHLAKEDIQVANRHIKRCSTLYVIREMQTIRTTKHNYTSILMVKIQNIDNSRC